MAKTICSAKLSELDSRLSRLHGRINGFEGVSSERLKEEISLLSTDLGEHRKIVQNSLNYIKIDLSEDVKNDLLTLIQTSENLIKRIHSELTSETDPEIKAEKQALLAEYALDLAIIAAENALVIALEAVEADKTAEKEEFI